MRLAPQRSGKSQRQELIKLRLFMLASKGIVTSNHENRTLHARSLRGRGALFIDTKPNKVQICKRGYQLLALMCHIQQGYLGDEVDGNTLAPESAGTPYTVDVVLAVSGEVVVDDQRHLERTSDRQTRRTASQKTSIALECIFSRGGGGIKLLPSSSRKRILASTWYWYRCEVF